MKYTPGQIYTHAQNILNLVHNECKGDVVLAIGAMLFALASLASSAGLTKAKLQEGQDAAWHDVATTGE